MERDERGLPVAVDEETRQARKMADQERCARMVQTAWRRKQGSYSAHLLRLAKREREEQMDKAARKMQRIWRGKKGRLDYRKRLENSYMYKKKQENLEEWGALMVQRVFRGKIGRRKFEAFKQEHARRWKQMYDQVRFFCNGRCKVLGQAHSESPPVALHPVFQPILPGCWSAVLLQHGHGRN